MLTRKPLCMEESSFYLMLLAHSRTQSLLEGKQNVNLNEQSNKNS